MADREPRLGNEVGYVLGRTSKNAGQVRIAKIVLVHDVADKEAAPSVNLSVFIGTELDFANQNAYPSTALWFTKGIKFDAAKSPGTWHWLDKHVAEVAPIKGKPADAPAK